ncbi:MAG: CinA family protein [Rhizobiaceae bacterium]
MTIKQLARDVIEKATVEGVMIATAESCTGGLIAAALTDIPGSSAALDCGFVTYSNDAKTTMLGVPAGLIAQKGAVCAAVARAMADGALSRSLADISVAVTGVAGPAGGTQDKPVGLVHIAVRQRGREPIEKKCLFQEQHPNADRATIRALTVETALQMMLLEIGG